MEKAKGADTKFMGGQVNASCWELLGMGKGLAWDGEVTRPSAYAPNDWWIDSHIQPIAT